MMRVSVTFNGRGLELDLDAETEPEKKMIGAVLNQPFSDTKWEPCNLDTSLVLATVHYDGHWSNKSVERLTLRVFRQESDGTHDIQEKP